MNNDNTPELDEAQMFRNELGALVTRWMQEGNNLLLDEVLDALHDEIFQLQLSAYLIDKESEGDEWKE